MTLYRELLPKFLIRCGFTTETNNPASERAFRIGSWYLPVDSITVDGYGGNQYKGFLYLEDALAYMKQSLEGEEGPYIYEVNEEQKEFHRAEDLLNFVQEKTNEKR